MDSYEKATHKPNRVISHVCAQCLQDSQSCRMCQGICIFSKGYMNKLKESEKVRQQIKSKYYKPQIDILRASLLKSAQEAGDETYMNDEEQYTIYELFERFHDEGYNQHSDILKNHCITNKKSGLFTSSTTQVKGACFLHRKIRKDDYLDPLGNNNRQSKRQLLIRECADPMFLLNKSRLNDKL